MRAAWSGPATSPSTGRSRTRWFSPGGEAAEKWGDLGEELRGLQQEIGDLVNDKGGLDQSWEGPSADAFCDYVNNDLRPAIVALADCADQASSTCSGISSSLTESLIIYFARIAAGIALCIASNYLDAIPLVGAFLCAMAKWVIVDAWIIGVLYDLYSMVSALMSLSAQQQQMETCYEELVDIFGTDGDKLDAGALERARKKVESVMEDSGGWNKP